MSILWICPKNVSKRTGKIDISLWFSQESEESRVDVNPPPADFPVFKYTGMSTSARFIPGGSP
jgi:hypothetical protein